MVGGVATAAAVRTFPFRVFSFPKEVKLTPPLHGLHFDENFYKASGAFTGISRNSFTLPFRIDPNIPKDEVWLVKEGRRETLLFHEGPRAGQTMTQWLTNPCIYRIVNFGPPPTLVAKIEPPSLFL